MEDYIKLTMGNLKKNNMDAFFVEDEAELLDKVKSLVKENDTIAVGGSMTLFDTGIIDFIRKGKFNFLDRYEKGLTHEEILELHRKGLLSDTYFTSSNAVTEDGFLYNVDGTGNRVASMIFGPKQVIVIIGKNKIVKDINAAIERNKKTAAPLNAKRLHRNTPCAKLGYCVDCKTEDRICNEYTVIKRQAIKGRIKVIIVNKELGY